MKLPFLVPVLAMVLSLGHLTVGFAQDAQDPQDDAAPTEKSAEDLEKEEKESSKKEQENTVKMMKVFKVLEAEWTGHEKVDYNNKLPGQANKKDVEWEDTWRGFFTKGGRYFEMEGETKGKLASSYHWVVTYDDSEKVYKAWSFGSTGFSEYTGELADDGKSVLWTYLNEMENMDVEDTFQFRVDGEKCDASGQTLLKSKDGSNSEVYSTHTSTYTRKKVEI